MSVLIKGMEMPKDIEPGLVIEFADGIDGKRYARLWHYRHGGLTEWLEAIPVPPHGRLGDLDKLEQMFVDIDNAPYSGFDGSEPFYSAEDAAQIIRLAPTIIPASGGKEDE